MKLSRPTPSSTSATFGYMHTVGLRELRQNASELVRRAEAGEEVVITVSGRPSARLVPARQRQWHEWEEIAGLFKGPADPDWLDDCDLIHQEISDPWDGR